MRNLFYADEMLKSGMPPDCMLKSFGLQRFNPHHVPAGSPEGGQFTTAEGAEGGAGITPRSIVPQGGTQVSVNAAELLPLVVPVGATILAIGVAGRDKVKPVPLNMEGEEASSAPTDQEKKKPGEGEKDKTDKPKPISKPEGVPENWIEKPSGKNGGKEWVNPEDSNDRIRVMPGDPDSKFPSQQKPYVVDQNGSFLDKNGNPIPGIRPGKTSEAHIPLSEYKFKR